MKMNFEPSYNPEKPHSCKPTCAVVCEYCDPKISRKCPSKVSREKEELFRKKWN